MLCQFVEQHHRWLRVWQPDDPSTRTLRLLTENCRRWVDERAALKNRLRQRLKEYFPLALKVGSEDLDTGWFLQLLKKYPSHAELQRANPKTLTKLFPKRSRVADDSGEGSRVTLVRSSSRLVTDRAVILTHRVDVLHLVRMISQLNEAVAEYDREIAEHMAQHCDAALFESFLAAGPAMAPRPAAAFVTEARHLQQLRLRQSHPAGLPAADGTCLTKGLRCLGWRTAGRASFFCTIFVAFSNRKDV